MTNTSVYYIIPLVMFLLMLVTSSHEKSISNAASIVGLVFFGYIHQHSPIVAFFGLSLVIFVMQIRAIVNHRKDSFLKR